MTKKQEILRLKSVAKELGSDSYIGPWLYSMLPQIEADMLSDLEPACSWVEMRSRQEAVEVLHRKAQTHYTDAEQKVRIAEKYQRDVEAARLQIRDKLANLEASIHAEWVKL